MVSQDDIAGNIKDFEMENYIELVKDDLTGRMVVLMESMVGVEPKDFLTRRGVVYIYTLGNKILKIGETSRKLPQRLQDYNKRRKGNTGDGELFQHLISCGTQDVVRMYLVFAGKQFLFEGDYFPTSSKLLEQIYIQKHLKLYGTLPPFNKVGW